MGGRKWRTKRTGEGDRQYLSMTGLVAEVQAVVLLALLVVGRVKAAKDNSEGSPHVFAPHSRVPHF